MLNSFNGPDEKYALDSPAHDQQRQKSAVIQHATVVDLPGANDATGKVIDGNGLFNTSLLLAKSHDDIYFGAIAADIEYLHPAKVLKYYKFRDRVIAVLNGEAHVAANGAQIIAQKRQDMAAVLGEYDRLKYSHFAAWARDLLNATEEILRHRHEVLGVEYGKSEPQIVAGVFDATEQIRENQQLNYKLSRIYSKEDPDYLGQLAMMFHEIATTKEKLNLTHIARLLRFIDEHQPDNPKGIPEHRQQTRAFLESITHVLEKNPIVATDADIGMIVSRISKIEQFHLPARFVFEIRRIIREYNGTFDVGNISDLLCSMKKLRYSEYEQLVKMDHELNRKVGPALKRRSEEADITEASLLPLVRACFMNDYRMPHLLNRKYNQFLNNYKPEPNKTELRAKRLLEEWYPGIVVLPCRIINGCELDLYCPAVATDKWPRGVVFELDGPFHNPEKDARRDKYLNSIGIGVFRIDLT